MRSLHIDLETYCEIDLKKAGTYRYAEQAEIMLFAYAYDDQPVQVVDMFTDHLPQQVYDDLTNPGVTKKAFNAAFEIECLKNYFNLDLKVEQWEDTQARVAMCGLPLNLDHASYILNVSQKKDKGGSALIRYFCIPCKPTKANGGRTRNYPHHDPVKWEQFRIYNGHDVDAERAVCKALSFYNISEFEHRQWVLDQKINQRGVLINIPFVRNAIKLINDYEDKLTEEAKAITGLSNPKSVAQLKKWLFEETDEEVESLNKESIPAILAKTDSQTVRRVLEIRQEGSKTSTKKYPRMLECVCRDGRVRGVHQYYGANRTGRQAHRLIQTGNLPRGTVKNIEPVRDLVMRGDADWLEFCYGAIPDTMSSLIRSAIIPAPGHRFLIMDFTSVEALVLAWLAGERWVLDLFTQPGKPKMYEATASRMFGLPIESVTGALRQKGKVASLALGFQGGVGALVKMGALKEGLTEEELPAIVQGWRKANPSIVNYWYALQKAAETAIEYRQRVAVSSIEIRGEYRAPDHGVYFYMKGKSLMFVLPSGRELVYCDARLEQGEYGTTITYWGLDQVKKKWSKLDTYSGKLAENATQSVARDLLMNGAQNLDNAGYETVLLVHDETVNEMPIGKGSLEEVNRLMVTLPEWAKDMPLKAAGEESFYYKK